MSMGDMIIATVKKTVWGWKGMVRVRTPEETLIDNGVQVTRPAQRYTKLCSTTRITRMDAMEDAEHWRETCIIINQLP